MSSSLIEFGNRGREYLTQVIQFLDYFRLIVKKSFYLKILELVPESSNNGDDDCGE